jgi:hypothetical protein
MPSSGSIGTSRAAGNDRPTAAGQLQTVVELEVPMIRTSHPLLLGLALLLNSDASGADVVRVRSGEELSQALRTAKPGTVISIAPGTYRGDLYQAKLKGTKEKPIVISGADPKNPPHRRRRNRNATVVAELPDKTWCSRERPETA